MVYNIVAPHVGESITEVSILKWKKQSGEKVQVGELLLEIESDKATVEIVADHNGVLKTLKNPGERIPVGAVIGSIDESGVATVMASQVLSPSVRKMVTEKELNPSQIQGSGKAGRLTKGDVIQFVSQPQAKATAPEFKTLIVDGVGVRRVPMSMLRSRIAERLVQAQHTAAILTTFNEIDMSAVIALRNKNKDAFKAKHGVPLSYMSFFTKAVIEGLKTVPEINAYIDGKDTLYHDYFDVGIAVGTERGLVVPVLRQVDKMSFLDIEKNLSELALKARDGKLSMAELTGGTFTISNGGTYGSLLSTPILNPPQSGILGMHKIEDRPVVIAGKVEVRPMMYVALSYDHRIVDGKGAVTFLVTLKDCIENPAKLKFEG